VLGRLPAAGRRAEVRGLPGDRSKRDARGGRRGTAAPWRPGRAAAGWGVPAVDLSPSRESGDHRTSHVFESNIDPNRTRHGL
jgi:hypothetical protein